MRIANNAMAINTHRQYTTNNASVAGATEKLSSGYRINRAGDDAAGLAISEKMRAQIKGLNMASKNSQDAISLVQTAEGALTETHSILQRMRELSVQAASDTNDQDVDRVALNEEFKALRDEIDDIAEKTAFNGKKLLNGAFAGSAGTPSSVSGISGLESGVGLTVGASVSAGTGSIDVTAAAGTLGASTNYGSDTTFTIGDFSFTHGATSATHNGATITFNASVWTAVDTAATGASEGEKATNAAAALKTQLFGAANSVGYTVTAGTPASGGMILQTGANTGDELPVAIGDMRANALHLDTYGAAIGRATSAGKNVGALAAGDAIDLTTQTKASVAVESVNTAINDVSTQRAKLGAVQNRLQHKINNLDTSAENLQAAESRIRDLDMAKEMTNYTKNNILVQASTAMLAQANAAPQGVLQLLQ